MFRRTHPEPAESIDMLRSKNLKKFTDVYTADGERIGVTLRFVHRPIEDVDIELRFYRSYLIVQSILLGGPAFPPPALHGGTHPARKPPRSVRVARTPGRKLVEPRA